MTPDQIVTLLGVVLAGVIGAVSAKISASASTKNSKEANAVTFSKTLIERVESLETDVETLRTDLDNVTQNFRHAINFIERMVFWARGGSKPPIPEIPTSLKEFFDPSLVERHTEEQDRNKS